MPHSQRSPEPIIYDGAKIINRNNLTIGEYSQIDDFTFINCGIRTEIGRYVHIACFCSVAGGGEFVMDDFSGLSAGCRIITGSDDFSGGSLTNPTVPDEFTNAKRDKVHLGRHVILGTNVIVFPGVRIGDGAAVAAGTIVRRDLEPWAIYGGQSCKKIRERPSSRILELEHQLLSRN